MTGIRFAVTLAGACPKAVDGQPHTRVRAGDSADLIAFGGSLAPDQGVAVELARCGYCGVALLGVGRYGTDGPNMPHWLELPDAQLGEG